ncbi:MAG: FAD-dependent oxidoreductase [Steroidobacteraceae bacterium]
MTGKFPNKARVVIIGGGIGGCSVAYHLGAMGVTDVVLLEQSSLSSGTTWHSTGNMETYRADPLIYEMVRYAVETYPRLARETGKEIGWRNVGRVHYTDREDRWAVMQTLPELGRARGIELHLMSAEEVGKQLPILDTSEIVGGTWIPSDARVNATDAVYAFASAARANGVNIFQETRVTGLKMHDGVICGVTTTSGCIDCATVVLASGLWSRDLAKTCGVLLPLYALEHQYLITKPVGIARDLPLFLSYDDQLYGREEVGGLLIGSLDDAAIALPTAVLPQNFSFSLLNERWEQFEPYMATAMKRFPLLRNAQIKMLLNGPESFTPDGQMLLGPVPSAIGLFAACAFNSNGIALAPAAGRFIAEWIVEGEPSSDIAPLDVRRFSPVQAIEENIRARATEIPGFHCRIHAPGSDYRTARDLRHSPLHAQFAAAGARFASVNGWERPVWCERQEGSGLMGSVAEEFRAATEGTLVVDRSADFKILCDPAQSGPSQAEVRLSHLSGSHDQIEAIVRELAASGGYRLLAASPEQESRVAEWRRRACRVQQDPPAAFVDQTMAFAMLELHGPGREAMLSKLLTSDGSEMAIFRDTVNDSALLLTPCGGAAELWQRLLSLGSRLGWRAGGYYVQEALRIAHGIPGFGYEATPARQAHELGFGMLNSSMSPSAPSTHAARKLAAFESPMPYHEFGSREVLISRGAVVGELTSRVRLPGWPSTLALGLLDPQRWQPGMAGAELETVAGGRRWPLALRETAWTANVAARINSR